MHSLQGSLFEHIADAFVNIPVEVLKKFATTYDIIAHEKMVQAFHQIKQVKERYNQAQDSYAISSLPKSSCDISKPHPNNSSHSQSKPQIKNLSKPNESNKSIVISDDESFFDSSPHKTKKTVTQVNARSDVNVSSYGPIQQKRLSLCPLPKPTTAATVSVTLY